jgi:hypothetical protein
MEKILFILKRKHDYNGDRDGAYVGLSTGLFNSASYVADLLTKQGKEVKMVVVEDNNQIDREVTAFRPTHVIVEAYWVVPEKFDVLTRLHPTVQWFVRAHSDIPFFATEGIFVEWTREYLARGVDIMVNSPRLLDELRHYMSTAQPGIDLRRISYAPNYYPVADMKPWKGFVKKGELHVGCFGAVRPLKNQMIQAFAALEVAKSLGRKLYFHINGSRVEGNGGPVLKNIRAFFADLGDAAELVEYEWMPREEFLLICAKMDIGMQVSFTETFNIVSADLTSQGVPIAVSSEVPWALIHASADPVDSHSIYRTTKWAYWFPQVNVWLNQFGLKNYSRESARVWKCYKW